MLDADVLMGIYCRLPTRISRWLRLGIKVHAHAAQALWAGISTPLGDFDQFCRVLRAGLSYHAWRVHLELPSFCIIYL